MGFGSILEAQRSTDSGLQGLGGALVLSVDARGQWTFSVIRESKAKAVTLMAEGSGGIRNFGFWCLGFGV